jgi:putative two-component system response regulator
MTLIDELWHAEDLSIMNPELTSSLKSDNSITAARHDSESVGEEASILVVDDDEALGRLIKTYLEMRKFSHFGVKNAFEALQFIGQKNINLVISDIKMRGINGIELMQQVQSKYPDMPFIIMTGYAPEYSYEDIINAGASDFIAKPFSMGELNAKILRIAREKNIRLQLQKTVNRVKGLLENTVGALGAVLEKRDPYTAGHQQRVGHLACAIAREMGLSAKKIEGLRLAAFVHDIGKVGVPSDVLSKPGKLSEAETDLIRVHSQIGYDILKYIDFPWPIAEMVLQHHERLDGTGYPQGLVGHEILLEALIIGVADVIEAISAHRPYRPALGLEQALEEIARQKGTLYDPEVVDACIKVFIEGKFTFE